MARSGALGKWGPTGHPATSPVSGAPTVTETVAPPRTARCARCGDPALLGPANPWRPFCSERCKMIDLGHWASGSYALPAEAGEAADDPGEGH